MLLPQHFFFLLLLPLIFDFLISFTAGGTAFSRGSKSVESHVIRLNSDLLSLVFGHLSLATLSLFPKGYVTKEDFRVCLENWLGHLQGRNDDELPSRFDKKKPGELANVKGANKIAQDLGLTGDKQETSLQLSDPFDNTQPAPWAWGLSLVLLQANKQLRNEQEPTLLMPWIFIPDSQVFHFIKMNSDVQWMKLDYNTMDVPKVTELTSKLKIDFKDTIVDLDVAYVWHHRNVENPTGKSKVGDYPNPKSLERLINYPWLKNYVAFNENVLNQLLDYCHSQSKDPNHSEKIKDLNDWVGKELKEVGQWKGKRWR